MLKGSFYYLKQTYTVDRRKIKYNKFPFCIYRLLICTIQISKDKGNLWCSNFYKNDY